MASTTPSPTARSTHPRHRRRARTLFAAAVLGATASLLGGCGSTTGEGGHASGGEASLKLPDLSQVTVGGGFSGEGLLFIGLGVCVLGLAFGLWTYMQLKALPVHRSMLQVSELIYSTCKAYLTKQGRFLLLLWAFITAVILVYYKALIGFSWGRVLTIVAFSLLGMAGS